MSEAAAIWSRRERSLRGPRRIRGGEIVLRRRLPRVPLFHYGSRRVAPVVDTPATPPTRHHPRAQASRSPRSSYVTWISALRPENAAASIEPRFLVPGRSPFLAVYEQAKQDFRNDAVMTRIQRTKWGGSGPGAAPRKLHRSPDLVVGLVFTLAGVVTAFEIELMRGYIYLGAVLCSRIASACSPRRSSAAIVLVLPFAVSWLLMKAFRLMFFFLLLVSVSAVEAIAAIGAAVCALLSLSPAVGRAAHQRTRRSAHLTRWASRWWVGVTGIPQAGVGA